MWLLRRAVWPIERADIHCRLRLAERIEIGGEGWIAEILRSAEQVHRVGRFAAQFDRRGADAAVANDDCGHALRKFGQHRGSADDSSVVVGVNVDEAGRQREAGSVDYFGRVAFEAGPISAMRSPRMATSASSGSAPLPSRTVAFRMRVSQLVICALSGYRLYALCALHFRIYQRGSAR